MANVSSPPQSRTAVATASLKQLALLPGTITFLQTSTHTVRLHQNVSGGLPRSPSHLVLNPPKRNPFSSLQSQERQQAAPDSDKHHHFRFQIHISGGFPDSYSSPPIMNALSPSRNSGGRRLFQTSTTTSGCTVTFQGASVTFQVCIRDSSGFTFRWNDQGSNVVQISVSDQNGGWIGFGIGARMVGSSAVVAFPASGKLSVHVCSRDSTDLLLIRYCEDPSSCHMTRPSRYIGASASGLVAGKCLQKDALFILFAPSRWHVRND